MVKEPRSGHSYQTLRREGEGYFLNSERDTAIEDSAFLSKADEPTVILPGSRPASVDAHMPNRFRSSPVQRIAGSAYPDADRRILHQRLAWLPVPLFIATAAFVQALQPQFRYESRELVFILYMLFCASPAVMVALLAGQTYLERGSARMLFLGAGAVVFCLIYAGAPLLLPDYNAGVTVHNFGFLLSGLCFLLSGLFGGPLHGCFGERRWLTVVLAYTAAAAIMGAWTWAAVNKFLPTFYVPARGYTTLRYLVIGAGVVTFAASSLWYGRLYHRSQSRFEGWFCQSLVLIAVAMIAASAISAGGTTMAWTARAIQCVGGVYMILAILSAVQDSGAWRIPLEQALRRHELQYRTIVENLSEGLVLTDAAGTLLLVNPAMGRLTGRAVRPGDHLPSHAAKSRVKNSGGEEIPLEQWPLSKALRGECVRDVELWVQHPESGREYTALYSAQPIHDDRGRVEKAVLTIRDISARKEAEESLRQLNERLEEQVAERTAALRQTIATLQSEIEQREMAQDQLRRLTQKTVAAMEHDRRALSKEIHDSIGGSLAAIKMLLETRLKSAGQNPAEGVASLEAIIGHLADTLKESKRISHQLRPMALDDFGLTAAIAENIRKFKEFYPKVNVDHRISVLRTNNIAEEIKTAVYRVIQEALNNIGKHSRADYARIELSESGDKIVLRVEDNGVGFDVPTTFNRNHRLQAYGMHSMKERVEICRGTFQVESAPGKGTRLFASIPHTPPSSADL